MQYHHHIERTPCYLAGESRNPALRVDFERRLKLELGEVACSRGEAHAFARRLADIRTRHDRKGRLIERLDAAGLR